MIYGLDTEFWSSLAEHGRLAILPSTHMSKQIINIYLIRQRFDPLCEYRIDSGEIEMWTIVERAETRNRFMKRGVPCRVLRRRRHRDAAAIELG